MGILDMSRHETPNISTVRINHEAHDKIDAEIREYQRQGGKIHKIPTGKSGIEVIPLNSDAGKKLSVERNKDRADRNEVKKKAKAGPGRPKQPRDERFQKAKNLMGEGKSMRESCRILGIARGTLRHWLDMDDEVGK